MREKLEQILVRALEEVGSCESKDALDQARIKY